MIEGFDIGKDNRPTIRDLDASTSSVMGNTNKIDDADVLVTVLLCRHRGQKPQTAKQPSTDDDTSDV